MKTANEILDLARSQIGTKENPLGSNNVIYNTLYYGHPVSGRAYPWCSAFISFLFRGRGLIDVDSVYSGDFLEYGQAHGMEVNIAQVQPGDIVVFDYGDGGMTDHIGIVEKRLGPKTFQTIEGNIHDQVARATRTLGDKCRMWFVRPNYTEETEEEEMGLAVTVLSMGANQTYYYPCWIDHEKNQTVTIDISGKGAVRVSGQRDMGDGMSERTYEPKGEFDCKRINVGELWKNVKAKGVVLKIECLGGLPTVKIGETN